MDLSPKNFENPEKSSPVFSIITVCRNPGESLTKCIHSVATQTWENYEHVIIDGQSDDGTIEKLKQSTEPKLRWFSEKDTGIAQAMNKGIEQSRGTWLLFLHSDDWFSSCESLQTAFYDLPLEPAILSYPVRQHHPNGTQSIIPNRGWCFKTRFKTTLGHQGTFIHRKLFRYLGRYDESFKITMDYEWFLRAYWARTPLTSCKPCLTEMRATGLSSQKDWKSLSLRFMEEKRAHCLNADAPELRCAYALYWTLYPFYRYLKHRLL